MLRIAIRAGVTFHTFAASGGTNPPRRVTGFANFSFLIPTFFDKTTGPHASPQTAYARGGRAVKYVLAFKPRSRKDLKALSSENLQRVLEKIEALTDNLAGDVKRLTDYTPEFRLRVGEYRVLFEIDGPTIIVYRVVHRREAYR